MCVGGGAEFSEGEEGEDEDDVGKHGLRHVMLG